MRDYYNLIDNKEKMKNLITLIAEENEDVATVQRKLMIYQTPEKRTGAKNEMVI